jgi:hypothetical protein
MIQDGENVPLNHKKLEDRIKTVEFGIPDYLLMPEHKKLSIELMDEIFFMAIGIHFLEPISKEKTIIKVVPQI